MAHDPSQILIFIADESYAVGLAAALASVAEHTQPLPCIFVVDAGLSEASRQRLSQVAPVSWIEPDAWRQLERSLPINSSYVSQAAWLKLFIPQLLPALPGVDRVVYMDCDMLTLESLAPLWDVPLQGKLLAAVRDFGMPCGHRGLEPLGWDMSKPYFNAGRMLLDLQVPYSSKPWAYLCSHPHRQLFFRQLDRTPWAGKRWRPEQRSLAEAACAELRRFASLVTEPGFDRDAFVQQVAAMLLDKSK
ncbi:hypothetical protein COHA_003858 [Chlorella ohadii]|uniref:Hexosyltransferase n=1 Tax=Chlorella ohadii TaxID=2649997 RepID=A0AAD5DY45_9CHLO|nr:hypothetical protein COHA_003858 [Chlorella ohadii]